MKSCVARLRSDSLQSRCFGGGGTVRTTSLHTDWLDLLRCLVKHQVRFLMIGGHAVSLHSEPRYTEDLDLFVEATLANGR